MIVDLHAHYPMHIVERGKISVWRLLTSQRDRLSLWRRVQATLVDFVGNFFNYRTFFSGPGVRMKYMRQGQVGVALSVLYAFFDEIDGFEESKPEAGSLLTLEEQREAVERHVGKRHPHTAAVAKSPEQLEAARKAGKTAIVHCVEGGFRLGSTPNEVTEAVEQLADNGIAYITLAHLIWRGVATDAPALPWWTDEEYHEHLPQPPRGLSSLGEAAVRAMVEKRVLIDLSHMSERSIHDTLALLDRLDPGHEIPVLATHCGYRLGKLEYMLDRATIERIKERRGVIGLIFSRHLIEDRDPPREKARLPRTHKRRFERSFDILCEHIDEIREITGSHKHTAIGSDLDGFIKPMLPGLEDMRDMAGLEPALSARYDPETAKAICSGNALRPLTTWWRGG